MPPTSEISKVDRAAAIIRDVVVLQRNSVNGNVYSDEALQDASRLIEGGHLINLKHKQGSGNYLAGLGKAYKPYIRDGKLYAGEVHLKPNHPNTKLILDDAESNLFNDTLALSIEVIKGNFTSHSSNGKRVVDRIRKMEPLALVQNGGTNSGLYEQSGLFEEEENEMKNAKELRVAYPEYVATIEQEARAKYAAEKEASFEAEKKPLVDRIADLEHELTIAKAERDVEAKKAQDFIDAAATDEKVDEIKAKAEEKGVPVGTLTEETFQELATSSDALVEQVLTSAVPKTTKGYTGGSAIGSSYKSKPRSKTRDILSKYKKEA